jgi:hypothetical protein
MSADTGNALRLGRKCVLLSHIRAVIFHYRRANIRTLCDARITRFGNEETL